MLTQQLPHHPVSLLPICGKIFERSNLNFVFLFLENNDSVTLKEAGFQSNDSCDSCVN